MKFKDFMKKLDSMVWEATDGNSLVSSEGVKLSYSLKLNTDPNEIMPVDCLVQLSKNERCFFSWGVESDRDMNEFRKWYFPLFSSIQSEKSRVAFDEVDRLKNEFLNS